jgi:hypothetical protein
MVLLACVVGASAMAGLLGAWAGFALFTHRACGFMALLALVDVAVLLRFCGLPAGRLRAVTGFLVVVLTIPLGFYLAAITNIGRAMGMLPHEAFPLTSPGFAFLWLKFNAGWLDALCATIGLLGAWRVSR